MPSGDVSLLQNPMFALQAGAHSGAIALIGGTVYPKLTGVTSVAASFYKDLEGSVWLKGLIKSGTVGVAVFTLPAGYRPLENLPFDVHSEDGISSVLGTVTVKSTGDVVVSVGGNALVSLSGINFRGEQ